MNYNPFLKTAAQAAQKAGEVMRQNFRKKQIVHHKNALDFATATDLACQKTIMETIKKAYPDHAILSEEMSGKQDLAKPWRWIIDPIDGTLNYAAGNPYCCVSIALQHQEETVVGVVYNPFRQELYAATKGSPTTCNGQKVHVSAQKFSLATVCMDWSRFYYKPRKFRAMKRIIDTLSDRVGRICSYNSGAYSMAEVSQGIFDAYFHLQTQPWDHAAACLIVEQAGGKATTVEGKLQRGLTYSVVVSNGKIHQSLLKIINQYL